jgi:hypothetical protein
MNDKNAAKFGKNRYFRIKITIHVQFLVLQILSLIDLCRD